MDERYNRPRRPGYTRTTSEQRNGLRSPDRWRQDANNAVLQRPEQNGWHEDAEHLRDRRRAAQKIARREADDAQVAWGVPIQETSEQAWSRRMQTATNLQFTGVATGIAEVQTERLDRQRQLIDSLHAHLEDAAAAQAQTNLEEAESHFQDTDRFLAEYPGSGMNRHTGMHVALGDVRRARDLLEQRQAGLKLLDDYMASTRRRSVPSLTAEELDAAHDLGVRARQRHAPHDDNSGYTPR